MTLINISQHDPKSAMPLIKKYESLALEAYLCPANVWTVGYGHTKNVGPGDVVTEAQADELLADDLQALYLSLCQSVRVDITEGQFIALMSLGFNIGASALAKSTLMRKLNGGNAAGAAAEFDRWIYAGGKPLNGLIRRRAEERAIFEG